MKSHLPKGFPNQDFLEAVSLSARFRLIMPGDERMACQRGTGKVKRIATMLHKGAAIAPGRSDVQSGVVHCERGNRCGDRTTVAVIP
jgi:hypothetical protein